RERAGGQGPQEDGKKRRGARDQAAVGEVGIERLALQERPEVLAGSGRREIDDRRPCDLAVGLERSEDLPCDGGQVPDEKQEDRRHPPDRPESCESDRPPMAQSALRRTSPGGVASSTARRTPCVTIAEP